MDSLYLPRLFDFGDYKNLLQLELTLCTQVGTSINSLGTILLSSHLNLQRITLDHASLDGEFILSRIVFYNWFDIRGHICMPFGLILVITRTLLLKYPMLFQTGELSLKKTTKKN